MKLQRIICVFLVLLFGLITISHADDNQYIVCSDNNLYKALCNYFGESKIIKKDDEKLIIEVSQETIGGATDLDLSDKKLKDLKGLEVFKNLVSFRARNNEISDLSPLSNLKTLQYINVSNNNISDLSLLCPTEKVEEGDLGLTELDLSKNKIADITSISTFDKLVSLNLGENQISSVAPISSIEKLEALYLNTNNITDISTITAMKNLKVLNLQNNKITKIENVEFENMNSLNLKNNKLSDVEFLKNINTLNGLDISYNQIARVPEFLANWINNKQIADIKVNNQKLNLVTQDKDVNFGKNSSFTNLLYFGFFYNSNLSIGLENGTLNTEKLIFTVQDENKTAKIAINDGVFKGSEIRIDYGGSTDIETAPSVDEVVIPDEENTNNGENNVADTETNTDSGAVDTNTSTENITTDTNTSTENTTTDTNTDSGSTTLGEIIAGSNNQNNAGNNDSTTANGKMPYTGVASKVMLVLTFISVVLVGAYTFSKNKK